MPYLLYQFLHGEDGAGKITTTTTTATTPGPAAAL